MKRLLLLLIVLLVLTGCSTKADYIQPVNVSVNTFSNLTCAQIKSVLITKDMELIELSKQQKKAARIDFWIAPVSKISGIDRTKEIAQVKGEINTLLELQEKCKGDKYEF